MPRRYATIEDAYARMKQENAFLTDSQARHLTIHAISRNEDGSWSWKFDNYLHMLPYSAMRREEFVGLLGEITCPVLLLYGLDSWAEPPDRDGRLEMFRDARLICYENAGHWLHHDQTARFLADLDAFL